MFSEQLYAYITDGHRLNDTAGWAAGERGCGNLAASEAPARGDTSKLVM